MWEKLRRFSGLDRTAQGLFLRALVTLPLVALRLKMGGFQNAQAALQRTFSTSIPEPGADVVKTRTALTAHMVNAADRHGFVHPSCLAKSLTLWCLLGRQGIASHLRIGIRKHDNQFEAHAWVERDGAALNEPEEHHHHYAAFDAAFASLPQDE